MNTSFKPGRAWYDTDVNLIQAHGGSLLFADGVYYWYGENKEKTKPASGIWHWGVRLYSSKDLYNWKSEGIILPPSEDYNSPLHPTQYMDRPHIIYNEKTKKFVMWVKIMSRENMGNQYMVVALADRITDEFKVIGVRQPIGYSSGDFDLAVDEKTKRAFIYFDKVHDFVHKDRLPHKDIVCAKLSEDYTDLTGDYANYHDNSPYRVGMEAPAFFCRGDKMYLFLSRTTGYIPNPTEYLVSTNYFGPWERGERVHEDKENLSFRSQICSVFKHPQKKDLYIAMADRWLMNLPEDLPDNMFEIANSKDDDRYETLYDERYDEAISLNTPQKRDMSIARYVWLPIVFENGRPIIRWLDEWRWEEF